MARRFLIWFWSGGGGGSQFAVRLAHRLSLRFGADNVFASLRADDPTVARAEALGLQVLRADIVSDRKRPLQTLASLGASARVLRAHIETAKPDAVIVAMNFAAAAPLALTLDAPLIYCAHDPAPHAGDYAAQWQIWTQSVLVRRAAAVVALSEFAAAQLRAQGVAGNKIATAPLASVYEPHARRPRADGPTRFLFTGRMIAYKGLDLLADALAGFAQRDWRLRIAGLGPAFTDALAARLALPQIEIVTRGWMDEAAMAALYESSDVLLAPYREATQSGVVAEAMAWGLPVAATPVGALGEQIGRGGWLAEAATPVAFADVMRAVLDAMEQRTKAAAAHEMATASWQGDAWGWLDRAWRAGERLP